MPISAKMINLSENSAGVLAGSMQLVLPTQILAELNTHKVMSKSSSSTRAIPNTTAISRLLADPFVPLAFQANQRGMVGGEELNEPVVCPFTGEELSPAEAWLRAMKMNIQWSRAFDAKKYHKQIHGRLLTPFNYTSTIVTSTFWNNFFDLRMKPNAEPSMIALATAMHRAFDEYGAPRKLAPGDWHAPYVDDRDIDEANQFVNSNPEYGGSTIDLVLDISAAKCARTSYWTHEGKRPTFDENIQLAAFLHEHAHASPFEHQLQARGDRVRYERKTGNMFGFNQYRKLIELKNPNFTKTEEYVLIGDAEALELGEI